MPRRSTEDRDRAVIEEFRELELRIAALEIQWKMMRWFVALVVGGIVLQLIQFLFKLRP